MMEFRIARGWRIFSALFATVLLTGGIITITHSFAAAPGTNLLLFMVGAVLVLLALFLFIETTVTRLTIDEDSMTLKRAYSYRSILLKDIEGFARGEKDSYYVSSKDGGKYIRIPFNLERREELIEWLQKKYPNLNAVEHEKETQKILENDRFGFTKEERKARLGKARQVARNSTIAAFVVIGWTLIYRKPYEGLMILLLVVPWVAIYFIWQFKGLMKLNSGKDSAYPSAIFFLGLPIVAVLVGAWDYDLYLFSTPIWRLLIEVSAPLALIWIIACKEAFDEGKRRLLTYGLMILFATGYSYGFLVFSNCFYDRSAPEKWRVKVARKHISKGKSTSYHLNISSWGLYDEGESINVSKSFYEEVETGDSVSVYLKKGKWNIPWYRVIKE